MYTSSCNRAQLCLETSMYFVKHGSVAFFIDCYANPLYLIFLVQGIELETNVLRCRFFFLGEFS